MGLTVSQIITPLRNARLVVLSLLANFVLMPLAAVALAALLRLDQPLGVGLLLLGTAAGAPFLPKLAQIAKGNLAFGVGLMVLLMVVTVGYLPLVLPVLLPGVSVNPAKIARSLFLLMLLPLAGALAVKARFAVAAARTKPVLDRVSNLSLILLVLLITAANINNVLAVFGTRGILAGLLFIAVGLGIGWLLGGPGMDTRRVLALGTAQRNIAAALVVGGQSFNDPKVVVMVVVVTIVSLLVSCRCRGCWPSGARCSWSVPALRSKGRAQSSYPTPRPAWLGRNAVRDGLWPMRIAVEARAGPCAGQRMLAAEMGKEEERYLESRFPVGQLALRHRGSSLAEGSRGTSAWRRRAGSARRTCPAPRVGYRQFIEAPVWLAALGRLRAPDLPIATISQIPRP